MVDPIDFKRRKKGSDDGFGELLFTTYHYEKGHVTHVPEERLPEDAPAIWRRMFDTVWYDADHVFRKTGNTHDQIIFLCAIATNGRIVMYSDDDMIDTLERVFWLQRQLKAIGEENLSPFKCHHHNDNSPKEPAE